LRVLGPAELAQINQRISPPYTFFLLNGDM
jgi:hypothetical protein